jgi:twitching motility protein PilT
MSDKEMVRAMLSGSLQGIVAQTLLQRSDGQGRVGAYEILVGTNAVRNLIRENQIPQLFSMMQTGSRYGMMTMEDAVLELLESKMITHEEARKVIMKAGDESGDIGSKNAPPVGQVVDSEEAKEAGYSF